MAKSTLGTIKTLTDLLRLRNAFISFFGVYVGAVVFALENPLPLAGVFTAALAAAMILGGGNALNDYFDVEIDRINQPKRPIPSGRISKSDAFMLSMALFLIGLGAAKSINSNCLAIAFANTFILILYAKYSKKLLLIANICISYLVASVIIFGLAAVNTSSMDVNPDGIKLNGVLAVCAFLITFSREIMKDIEDMEGDRRAYSLTVPLVWGVPIAKKLAYASALVAVALSLMPLAFPSAQFNEFFYGIIILVADLTIIVSFNTPPKINQRLLVTAMSLALIAFLLGALSLHYLPAG